MTDLPRLAIVGHTNTGKTSLMRTLTRDRHFGKVSDRPATTRHVEGVELRADGTPALLLHDTPGMEDAIALAELLEDLAAAERLDGPDSIARLLDSPQAKDRFEQEAKVLRQMLACDAALYVVDARDPVLAKYRDELAILARCARPLLPVLNFVSQPGHRADEWRAALARLGLHAIVGFDTVAPELDGERRLYAALATLIEAHRPALERLIEARARESAQRLEAARRLIATLLIDVAAWRVTVDEAAQAEHALNDMHAMVRKREQACVAELLALYGFRSQDARPGELPLLDGRWQDDLFSAEALREAGIRLGTGAAAGAAAGMGIDLVAGGLTLGAAAALGALAGSVWQTVEHYGDRLAGKLRGYSELTVDDAILRLLALRAQRLLHALERRGHAAIEPLELPAPEESSWREGTLPAALGEARIHARWSALSPRHTPDESRDEAIGELAGYVEASAAAPATKD